MPRLYTAEYQNEFIVVFPQDSLEWWINTILAKLNYEKPEEKQIAASLNIDGPDGLITLLNRYGVAERFADKGTVGGIKLIINDDEGFSGKEQFLKLLSAVLSREELLGLSFHPISKDKVPSLSSKGKLFFTYRSDSPATPESSRTASPEEPTPRKSSSHRKKGF